MNAPLSTDSDVGLAVRADLIRARLLVPEAQRQHQPSSRGMRLDTIAFDSVAIEIVAAHGALAAREIATALPSESAVRVALLALLALDPAELRARIDRHCARSSRRERHERHARREREPGYESRGMRDPRR